MNEKYINRELSLLEFNKRVLEQGLDPDVPLLERLRFLCITCTNLDEFFEIRVAALKQRIEIGALAHGAEKDSAQELFDELRDLQEVVAVVRVAHDHVTAAGRGDPTHQRTAVSGPLDPDDAGAEPLRDHRRLVGAAVVGNDDFAMDAAVGDRFASLEDA